MSRKRLAARTASVPKPIEDMDGAELRKAGEQTLDYIEKLHLGLRRAVDHMEKIEARLLNDPTVRLKKGEGIPTASGILRVHEERKGRAYVVKEEVDKIAGELPEYLRPQRDRRLVIESFNALQERNTALAAELLSYAADPLDPAEEPLVEVKEKVKYATVAAIKKEMGDDSSLIGKSAVERMVVLERPGIGDEPLLIYRGGMVGAKPKKEDR